VKFGRDEAFLNFHWLLRGFFSSSDFDDLLPLGCLSASAIFGAAQQQRVHREVFLVLSACRTFIMVLDSCFSGPCVNGLV
jgi:hypothetical protein